MTHFTTDQGNTMKTPSILRTLVALAVLTLSLGALGCDSNKAQLNGLNNGSDTGGSTSTNNGTGADAGTDVAVGPTDPEGHGTAPGEEQHIDPGFMNGSWRTATTSDDTPVAYFDTFQDKGDPSVTGTFLMGLGVYPRLDGESGDVAQSSFDGTTLTLKWNPTNDSEEMFTLQATKSDDNTMSGTITSARNPDLNVSVTLTRHLAQ